MKKNDPLVKEAKKYIKAWKWANGYTHKEWSFQMLAEYMASFTKQYLQSKQQK